VAAIEQRLPLGIPSTNQPATAEVSPDGAHPRRAPYSLEWRTSILTEVIYMINRNIATPQSWRMGTREAAMTVRLPAMTIAAVSQHNDL
jgi:hypothetical protein